MGELQGTNAKIKHYRQKKACFEIYFMLIDADALCHGSADLLTPPRLFILCLYDTSRHLDCHPIITMTLQPQRTHCVPNHSETQSKIGNHAMVDGRHDSPRQCRNVDVKKDMFNHRNLQTVSILERMIKGGDTNHRECGLVS